MHEIMPSRTQHKVEMVFRVPFPQFWSRLKSKSRHFVLVCQRRETSRIPARVFVAKNVCPFITLVKIAPSARFARNKNHPTPINPFPIRNLFTWVPLGSGSWILRHSHISWSLMSLSPFFYLTRIA